MNDNVTLRVNGREWNGWTSVRIGAGIERLARDFSVEITRQWPGDEGITTLQPRIKNGSKVEVLIGDELVITGWVEATPVRYDARSVSTGIAGSVIQRDDLVQYTATADATSSGGVLRVPIACSTAGAVGNADDGTALILVTPVNGLPSSGVTDTLTGGFDTEDLETWRARVIERYYWTPQGGADGDYVVWAKEVPGITRAWTYRHWMGTGTVGVMIAGSDLINPIPEESTETAARQHIGPLAPVAGSDLYVFRPVAHTVDFHIRVTPDTPEIRAAITAELRSFLLRDGYPQGELKVSRISEAISGANGEYSHQLLAPAENISIAKNELAVLGTISWT
ncbi:TPA: baseplate J/gp47 family protein [Escherichia coli]|uniref:baseplate J/gp47 family protein n=1 Tax=Escherichia coli TaxID=562 RepID=UPI002B24A76D|nr:baseplate J/gp47 family protein [Escherichia coli]MEB2415424.1 baseplate J/gp47 family protein [Escherichia coli]